MTKKNCRRFLYFNQWLVLPVCSLLLLYSCNTLKHVKEDEYLLRTNNIKLRSDRTITNKGILQDQLNALVLQKPNTYWSGWFPVRLWRFNLKSEKYINKVNQDLPRGLERPVIYDSVMQARTAQNMNRFLQNQGYFNATVEDTVRYKKNRRAEVEYRVTTGANYLIDRTFLDIDDSVVSALIQSNMRQTKFRKEVPYTKALADEERARIITLMQNNGYYKFSQDNVSFELDTLNKDKLRDADNLIESAINFITLQKRVKKNSLDIKTIIRKAYDSSSYSRYRIGRMRVFPDFIDRSRVNDSDMTVREIDRIVYRYHDYYVREQVVDKQIFIHPGELYSRANHELTINKLNELGIFQMVNVVFVEDTLNLNEHVLNCYVLLSPHKKLDAGASYELSNTSVTYRLGNVVGLSYRDKNLFRRANLFTISAMGGVEAGYNREDNNMDFLDRLFLQSVYFGLNSTLVFPKFISPFRPKWLNDNNLPRTQLQVGVNVMDRTNQFRLTNISSSFSYNWRQSDIKTWDFTPAFANIILPVIRPEFQAQVDSVDYLKNSFRRTFIEGESLFFTFSDQQRKQNRNFNYLRIGIEEAGLLMSAVSGISRSVSRSPGFIFDQYVKLDLDARRYFNARHSLLALRFLAGIGAPYGDSRTLPYIKQYFVGGPYSIRGWQARRLAPDSVKNTNIDRTGDIKLEMSAEYRFDMIQLFSGTLNLNGALFADAGNTWLAKKDPSTPYGELDISRLGHDIAVSTGAGLRVVVAEVFTVRLDAAFPIKNPYIGPNNGWVIRQVDLGSSAWRRNNIVLNVAIGMPF